MAGKILIVEDEMIVQMHLRSIVEGLGLEVVGAEMTTEGALAAAEQNPPDLVLMDIHLAEGGNGLDTAAALHERFDCGVIFITAHSDGATIARASELFAAGYLIKPFTTAEVSAAVSTGLASHGRLRQVRARGRTLSSALGGLGEGVLVVDGSDVICFASPRAVALTGSRLEETEGADLFAILRPAGQVHERALRDALRRTRGGGRAESPPRISIVDRGGAERSLHVRLESLEDTQDSAGCVLLNVEEYGQDSSATRARALRAGDRLRLLVYSHDTLGLGHLRRSHNLIRALARTLPDLSTLLVTGSPLAHRYELPPGTDYLKLPAVRKTAPESYESRSLSMSDDAIHGLRSKLLQRTIRDYEPDILLVDHSPTGMNGELLPALDWLRRHGQCTCILGLRDIIDAPDRVVASWARKGIYDVLRESYDHILVYGSRSFFDTPTEYRFPEDLVAKTRFLNHVTGEGATSEDARPREHSKGSPRVVLTIGGGDGGYETVILPFLAMLHRFHARMPMEAELILGPFVPDERVREIRSRSAGLPVQVHGFVQSPTALYREADLVVATAGYNTTVELLAHAARAILIPRVLHRQEQLIRAERMDELGLMTCLPPQEVTEERLFDEIRRQLGRTGAPLAEARSRGEIPLDGAARFAEFCHRIVPGSSTAPVSG